MKLSMRFIVTLILLGLLSGCTFNIPTITIGSGVVIREGREVSNFDGVNLAGSADLVITTGDNEALIVEAEDNILPLIETNVRNGTLYLGMKPNIGVVNPRRDIKYFLTVRTLNELRLSGSASITAEELTGDDVTITVSGSGEVSIGHVSADAISVQVSGSGDIDMNGTVNEQTIRVSGSGNYRAGNLASQIADIDVSGSGAVTVWVSDSLNIDISGSGSVQYYGNPLVDQRVSGSGNTRSLGVK